MRSFNQSRVLLCPLTYNSPNKMERYRISSGVDNMTKENELSPKEALVEAVKEMQLMRKGEILKKYWL